MGHGTARARAMRLRRLIIVDAARIIRESDRLRTSQRSLLGLAPVVARGLFFGRNGRALDTCPKMNYLRDSLATGALKTMGKSHLALVAPTTIMGQ